MLSWFELMQHGAALVAVLALIGVAAWMLRRAGPWPRVAAPGQGRLHVVESLVLDPRRRLVVVRLDTVEHLLVLGPEGTTVVGRNHAPPDPRAAD